MNPIARVLGLSLLESVAVRLPPAAATGVHLGLIILGSFLPIVPLLRGAVHLADLLAYTVLGMVWAIAGTAVRLRTLTRRTSTSEFLAVHYTVFIGILCLVCGVWAVILLARVGPSGGWLALLPMAVALFLGQAWSVADGWFARGGRHVARVWQVVLPGYLRFVPVLSATVLGAIAYLSGADDATLVAIAGGLVLVQTLIDLGLALAALRLRPQST